MRLLEKLPRMRFLQNFPASVFGEIRVQWVGVASAKRAGVGKVLTVGVENSPTVWFAKGQGFEDVDLVGG